MSVQSMAYCRKFLAILTSFAASYRLRRPGGATLARSKAASLRNVS